ncbi:MAG TPA: type II toxin-antitoxin system RelE/ParE family toxin [Saprospiraceae bacterium]|nr:type II toxin-antitoxin system RelE/ParE family toxin [Saprospiraceae bacterium]
MAKVNWTFQALGELAEISEFLEKGSPKYAEYVVDTILETVKTLENFPKLGRKVPETNISNLRELLILNYRVVYFYTSKEVVEIITIRHSARPLPETTSDE